MRNQKLRTKPLVWLIIGLQCTAQYAVAQTSYAYQAAVQTRMPYQEKKDSDKVPEKASSKQTLSVVLKDLNKSKGVFFLYSDQSLGNTVVNAVSSDKETDLEKILEQVLKNTGLKYKKVGDKTFVILQKKESYQPGKTVNFNEVNETDAAKIDMQVVADVVSGKVTGSDGSPITGVSVVVKGTKKGTQTNGNGAFTIEASKGDVLVFSSVGYQTIEITVSTDNIAVTLKESTQSLSEVVVTTALGIQRKSKSLTYSTQKVSGDELSTVKDANVINGLAGKAAGVTITRSTSGVGGSARVILRGNKSTRENQPLYVIDGVPMANFSPAQPGDVWGQSSGAGTGGRDGGDGISNINPDDIESINILKGASAAALYGSQAANGVIIITTKKGRAGKSRVEFSSNLTMESPMLIPKLQFGYGQTQTPSGNNPGTAESWGAKVNAPDHVKDFFRTGSTWINSLAVSGGNATAQTYFSYSNTSSKGIIPTSKFDRHTLNFRETLKLFDDKLSIDANVTFLTQKNHNRAVSGMYNNPLTGLYLLPRGQDFNSYKNNFEYTSASRNLALQNWWNINFDKGWGGDDNQQNPFWALYRNERDDSRDRGLGAVNLRYQANKWLSIQARGNFDKSYDKYELRSFAGTQSVLAASNGRYTLERAFYTQLYGDLIVTASHKLTDELSLTANVGTSILDLKANDRTFVDTDPTADPGLGYANKFFLQNILPTALRAVSSIDRKQTQSVFASTNLGYKDYLFLDLTARNDWSSTFAFTPTANKGYFYYSAGLTAVVSDMVQLPQAISFAKARLSYARVGNDIAPYATHPPQYFLETAGGNVNLNLNTKTYYPGTYLKPEDNRSFEAGAELRFLNNKLGIDFTFYKNNNYRQYMEIPAPLGSGYSTYYLNLGNIQNSGIELMLTAVPYKTKDVNWTSTVNLASNKNKIIQLSDASIPGAGPDNKFEITGFGVNMFGSFIKEGGAWGDIYANKEVKRGSNGDIVVDANGAPITNSTGVFKLLGNPNPKLTLGWNNSFDFKNFAVSFLIDGRFGGQVMSVTQAVIDKYGVSEASGAARDNGGVDVPAQKEDGSKYSGKLDAQKYYTAIGGRDGAGEMYIYKADNIRLRELAIGYQLPVTPKFVKEIKVGFIARNLFFFSKKAPFDPETSMGTGNGLQGVETFGLPATRSYGLNVKFVF